MNTTDDNRPFGYWITAVDRLMRTEFATLFEDEGISRREWRMLNRIDGTVPDARPLHPRKLHRLIELGWIERTGEGWALTDAGTLATQRLRDAVDELRSRVAGAVTPEEFDTMTSALQKIAREFGWEDGKRLPRGRGHRRSGHGHSHRHHDDHGHDSHGQCHRSERIGRRGFPRHPMPATHLHIHTHG